MYGQYKRQSDKQRVAEAFAVPRGLKSSCSNRRKSAPSPRSP